MTQASDTVTGQIYIAGEVWSVQIRKEEFYFKGILENWIRGDPIAIKENLKEEDFLFLLYFGPFLSIRKKVIDIDPTNENRIHPKSNMISVRQYLFSYRSKFRGVILPTTQWTFQRWLCHIQLVLYGFSMKCIASQVEPFKIFCTLWSYHSDIEPRRSDTASTDLNLFWVLVRSAKWCRTWIFLSNFSYPSRNLNVTCLSSKCSMSHDLPYIPSPMANSGKHLASCTWIPIEWKSSWVSSVHCRADPLKADELNGDFDHGTNRCIILAVRMPIRRRLGLLLITNVAEKRTARHSLSTYHKLTAYKQKQKKQIQHWTLLKTLANNNPGKASVLV